MKAAEWVHESETTSNCLLCPNFCRVAEGKIGRCLGRGRKDGRMIANNYGIVVAAHSDPIEKKPLYHFHPGSSILSVGTFGCNFTCNFCQNHQLSQEKVPGEFIDPTELAQQATRIPGNIGVAFTYNEPGIWYEYVMDVLPLLRPAGLKGVLVTNGYLSPEPWQKLCSLTDAMNIDLKGFSEEFYQTNCHGKLQTVLDNILTAVKAGVHVELTNLVVTNRNTDQKLFADMVSWIEKVSPEIPLHISRYFPMFRETEPATDTTVLKAFYRIASERLKFVYVGNCELGEGNNTRCPDCQNLWIKRHGYSVEKVWHENTCSCGRKLPIIGFEQGA